MDVPLKEREIALNDVKNSLRDMGKAIVDFYQKYLNNLKLLEEEERKKIENEFINLENEIKIIREDVELKKDVELRNNVRNTFLPKHSVSDKVDDDIFEGGRKTKRKRRKSSRKTNKRRR